MSVPTCAVTVRISGASGASLAGATVRAQLTVADAYQGLVVPNLVEGITDVNGECVLSLFPNALGSTGSRYLVTVRRAGVRDETYFAVIPDVPAVELQTCLVAEQPEQGSLAARDGSRGSVTVLRGTLTNSTGFVSLTTNGAAPSANNRLQIADATSMWVSARVVARNVTTGDTRCWRVEGLLKRGAGAASTAWFEDGLPGSFGDTAGAGWSITVLADTVVGALVIRFATGTALAQTVSVIAAVDSEQLTP